MLESIDKDKIGLIVISEPSIFKEISDINDLCTELKELEKEINIPIVMIVNNAPDITDSVNIIPLPDCFEADKIREFVLL